VGVQSCGVVTLREGVGFGHGPAVSLCANAEMRLPKCHEAHERGRLETSGRYDPHLGFEGAAGDRLKLPAWLSISPGDELTPQLCTLTEAPFGEGRLTGQSVLILRPSSGVAVV